MDVARAAGAGARDRVVALAIGGAIELAQFAGSLMGGFSYRITDVDDAIMNASGAVAALSGWRPIERVARAEVRDSTANRVAR